MKLQKRSSYPPPWSLEVAKTGDLTYLPPCSLEKQFIQKKQFLGLAKPCSSFPYSQLQRLRSVQQVLHIEMLGCQAPPLQPVKSALAVWGRSAFLFFHFPGPSGTVTSLGCPLSALLIVVCPSFFSLEFLEGRIRTLVISWLSHIA